jgi:hypothetical protein
MDQYPEYDDDNHTLRATLATEQDGDVYIYETDDGTCIMLEHGQETRLSSFGEKGMTPDQMGEMLQRYNDTGQYDIIIESGELIDNS